MISVSTDNYLAVVRAAQLQSLRTGAPVDEKQTVAVAVREQVPPPAPPDTDGAVSRIVNVLV
jgi:hypothetical protein